MNEKDYIFWVYFLLKQNQSLYWNHNHLIIYTLKESQINICYKIVDCVTDSWNKFDFSYELNSILKPKPELKATDMYRNELEALLPQSSANYF